jgi:hypothetical protein
LKLCCGLPVPVRLGDCCQSITASGIRFFKRFDRRSALGIFEKLFEHFSGDSDLECLLIDLTIVRARRLAPPERQKRRRTIFRQKSEAGIQPRFTWRRTRLEMRFALY